MSHRNYRREPALFPVTLCWAEQEALEPEPAEEEAAPTTTCGCPEEHETLADWEAVHGAWEDVLGAR